MYGILKKKSPGDGTFILLLESIVYVIVNVGQREVYNVQQEIYMDFLVRV
jgi:hypothetical protein